jgi:hypothetical protein
MVEDWRQIVAGVVGSISAVATLGGRVWHVSAARGDVVVKESPGALHEANGLTALAALDGAPAVPEVLLAAPGLIVTTYVRAAARIGAASARSTRA